MENQYAKTHVHPTAGVNDFVCPYCKSLARIGLSYEWLAHIRAYGGGTDTVHCIRGHQFPVMWYVWSPMREVEEEQVVSA